MEDQRIRGHDTYPQAVSRRCLCPRNPFVHETFRLPNLDALDVEAFKALVVAQHSELLQQYQSNAQQIEHSPLSLGPILGNLYFSKVPAPSDH